MTQISSKNRAPARPRAFTGRHIAGILIAFFGVIVIVNFTMAWFASATFGGLVVKNSYVASQKFNGWLEQARQQKALGWSLNAERGADGHIVATLMAADQPLTDARIGALARHPLGRAKEQTLEFRAIGQGRYQSLQTLPEGRWTIHLNAQVADKRLDQLIDLR